MNFTHKADDFSKKQCQQMNRHNANTKQIYHDHS